MMNPVSEANPRIYILWRIYAVSAQGSSTLPVSIRRSKQTNKQTTLMPNLGKRDQKSLIPVRPYKHSAVRAQRFPLCTMYWNHVPGISMA